MSVSDCLFNLFSTFLIEKNRHLALEKRYIFSIGEGGGRKSPAKSTTCIMIMDYLMGGGGLDEGRKFYV